MDRTKDDTRRRLQSRTGRAVLLGDLPPVLRMPAPAPTSVVLQERASFTHQIIIESFDKGVRRDGAGPFLPRLQHFWPS